jgi:hypothetical protein
MYTLSLYFYRSEIEDALKYLPGDELLALGFGDLLDTISENTPIGCHTSPVVIKMCVIRNPLTYEN